MKIYMERQKHREEGQKWRLKDTKQRQVVKANESNRIEAGRPELLFASNAR